MGSYWLGLATGVGAALLVLALVCYQQMWEFLKEEYRYRKGGVQVWWLQRKERKQAAHQAAHQAHVQQVRPMDAGTQVHLLARIDTWAAEVWCTCGQRFNGRGGKGAFNKLQDHMEQVPRGNQHHA